MQLMLRANVYSVEPLLPEARDAVYDGIDQFAILAGEDVQLSEKSTGCDVTELKALSIAQIAPCLDWQVQLHLIVKPLEPVESLGLAYVSKGIGFVDLRKGNQRASRVVTAHETAHAFGCVIEGAEHSNPASPHHCADPKCIMHHQLNISKPGLLDRQPHGLDLEANALSLDAGLSGAKLGNHDLRGHSDFCKDCTSNIKTRGAGLVDALRLSRMMDKAVTYKTDSSC